MKIKKTPAPRGRPRAFNKEEALDKALDLFWTKGYEGTSLPDLTEAMGINRPSLYAAFGNKEALFNKVLDRYDEVTGDLMTASLNEPKVRDGMERLLYGATGTPSDFLPRGCLITNGALVCSKEASSIQKELVARRNLREARLCERFERAQAEGDLPADSNPADLARYISIILQGISVQVLGGTSSEELKRVVEIYLKAWPT